MTARRSCAVVPSSGTWLPKSASRCSARARRGSGSPGREGGARRAANSYDYVYTAVKPDVRLSSISGGTDIVSCFALGNPIGPVYRGEIQTRGLGMKVEVFDDAGTPVVGKQGELVCTAPFPS